MVVGIPTAKIHDPESDGLFKVKTSRRDTANYPTSDRALSGIMFSLGVVVGISLPTNPEIPASRQPLGPGFGRPAGTR